MKTLKCRSLLIALTSLLWVSVCLADGVVVVLDSATVGHDQRTKQPILRLIFASKERFRTVSADNLGEKVDFLVSGRVVLTSVIREPLSGGQIEISDQSWTDQDVVEFARQFSEAPKGEIEIRRSFPSK
jgi:hypothetical protein